jgi:hypothetical protein
MSNKQMTAVEEAAEKANGYNLYSKETKGQAFNEGFTAAVKWQAKRMYSEIHLILENVLYWDTCPDDFKEDIKKWLNDYKQDNEQ